jgi:quinone-modifying oxidoreductase, subunit QmoB
MDQKIGVYLCSGCGIGESVDLDAVAAVAGKFGIAKCLSHEAFCGAEGAALIRKDVEDRKSVV